MEIAEMTLMKLVFFLLTKYRLAMNKGVFTISFSFLFLCPFPRLREEYQF